MNESINLAKRLANVFIAENESQPSSTPGAHRPPPKENGKQGGATADKKISNIENSDPTQNTNNPQNTPRARTQDFDIDELEDDTIVEKSLDYSDPQALSFHLKNLLEQDDGETILEIGVDSNGNSLNLSPEQLSIIFAFIKTQAQKLNACASLVHSNQQKQFILIRTNTTIQTLLEIRIAVVGNVDAGKSTLLGVLTKNVLDDGRGRARLNLFKHKHEIESGRTSSVGMEVLGFQSNGVQVTPSSLNKPKISWEDVSSNAAKIITFVDLAGHEKYLKTTVFGLTGCSPDYVMLIIAANNGIIGMTKEHLSMTLQLHIPLLIIITKIDMTPPNILQQTITHLEKVLRQCGSRKLPIFVKTMDDVFCASDNFVSERICPIFQLSNTSGENLNLLLVFLNILKQSKKYDASNAAHFECHISDSFSVPGVGTVVSGTIMSGVIHSGDTIQVGPDANGQFHATTIKSIHRKRLPVQTASAGHNASFALKKIKRHTLRKGTVLLSHVTDAIAVYEFWAEILVLFHSTTISDKYHAMVHIGCVRQTARIVEMDKLMRTGDRGMVKFRFMRFKEYLTVGSRLLFREGKTKGVGKIVKLCYGESNSINE